MTFCTLLLWLLKHLTIPSYVLFQLHVQINKTLHLYYYNLLLLQLNAFLFPLCSFQYTAFWKIFHSKLNHVDGLSCSIFYLEVTTKSYSRVMFERFLVIPWKYNNTRNTISFSVSEISFIFLMTPINSTNDQNKFVELFKATFTH